MPTGSLLQFGNAVVRTFDAALPRTRFNCRQELCPLRELLSCFVALGVSVDSHEAATAPP